MILLSLIVAFSSYGFFHEDHYVRAARDPQSSLARANEDSLRDFSDGRVRPVSYIGLGDECVTPIVSMDELERRYPSIDRPFSYHGLCWWLRGYRATSYFYEHNQIYATAYNANMLMQVHLAHGLKNGSKAQ